MFLPMSSQDRACIKQIVDWFTSNGGKIHPAVEIALSDNYAGYCLHVRDDHDLPASSLVVSCPRNIVLSVLNVDKAAVPWPAQLKLHWHRSPEVLTRLFLVEQFLLNEQSFWHPYIQMLPQPSEDFLDTPLFYTEEDMAWLRGTNLEGTKVAREKQWRHEYDESMDLLGTYDKERHQVLCNKWELYLWAATILTSRCFSSSAFGMNRYETGPDNSQDVDQTVHIRFPLLLPVFDIANHNPGASVSWGWHNSSCSLTTQSDLKAGDEVFICYDQKGNEELILGYGFSIFRNPADAFRLLLKNINASERLLKLQATHKDIRSKEDASKFNTSIVCGTALSNPDIFTLQPAIGKTSFFIANPDLSETFSVLVANQRELNEICISKDGVSGFFIGSQITRNQAKVASSLAMELERKYSGITKYDSDLPPWPKNSRQFHAARYRRSQLRVLKTNIESLKSLLHGANSAPTHLVRLEEILAHSTNSSPNELRVAVYHVLRTRNAKRIRESGYTDLVFTLWICGCYLTDLDEEDNPPLNRIIYGQDGWLVFIHGIYGSPPVNEGGQWRMPEHLLQKGYDPEYNENEDQAIAMSYFDVVKTVAEGYPDSIFADQRWNVGLLSWALRIVQEEGLVCPAPDPGGMGGNEFVVFISKKP